MVMIEFVLMFIDGYGHGLSGMHVDEDHRSSIR